MHTPKQKMQQVHFRTVAEFLAFLPSDERDLLQAYLYEAILIDQDLSVKNSKI